MDDMKFVSTGLCPDCPECADNFNLGMKEYNQAVESGSISDEGYFSWYPCIECGSALGGSRHVAHGVNEDGELCHWHVCVDCLYRMNGIEEE